MIVSQIYLFLDEMASELRKDCENFCSFLSFRRMRNHTRKATTISELNILSFADCILNFEDAEIQIYIFLILNLVM